MTKSTVLPLSVLLLLLILSTESFAKSFKSDESDKTSCCGPRLIKKDQWKPIFSSKFGEISTVQVENGCGGMGPYTIHSITLEPNALLLPLFLHSDMVFFVDSGSGVLNWVDVEEPSAEIKRGDVYRLRPGSIFYLQNKPVDILLGTRLRLYALFSSTSNNECLNDSCFGAYSSLTDFMLGFDKTILQSAFGVPEEVIGLLSNRTQPPLIGPDTIRPACGPPCEEDNNIWPRLLRVFTGDVVDSAENKKKKKEKEKEKEKKEKKEKKKTINVFESEPDFESPNGRTLTINKEDLKVLDGTMVGVSMVNLTQGSMMGPHWYPWACEISIVLKGSGMVRVLRNSVSSKCENSRFKVEEGDIFVVPRLHPMAQLSFMNESLVTVGFTTSDKNHYNEPQFLGGKKSPLRSLDKEALAASFNVSDVMIEGLLGTRKEAAVLGCPFCAEGELKRFEESKGRDEQKKREEEEARKEEEERRKREEEEEEEEEEEKKRWPPQPQPEQPPQPFQPPEEGPQGTQPSRERDYERKREEEQAKKDAEERLWPSQPEWLA